MKLFKACASLKAGLAWSSTLLASARCGPRCVSWQAEAVRLEIGDKAARRCVGDRQLDIRTQCRLLGRDAARPEHLHQPRRDRVDFPSIQWIVEIRADSGRVADVDRSAVIPCGNPPEPRAIADYVEFAGDKLPVPGLSG